MSETERPKLANLVSVIFIIAAIGIILLGYIFFLKPLSSGPSTSSFSSFSFLLGTPEGILTFFSGIYIPKVLSIQMSASNYTLMYVFVIILAVILVVSAFGFAYRKKWGYYLAIISSIILIATPFLGYILGFPIIYIVGGVVLLVLGIIFILYLRGDVKKEF
ncbi:MAG: hypothetical protein WED07_06745 [Candidatus Freyarchaeum deiterrae]